MNALVVIGSGLVTPVGFNAPASLGAIRAGVSGVTCEHLWDWESGQNIIAGKVDLPQWSENLEKLADLVAPAISECLAMVSTKQDLDIPILLGIAPQNRAYRWDELDDRILNEIEYRLNIQHNSYSMVIPHGGISGVVALKEAHKLLVHQKSRYCIVAGVDSFLMQEMIEPYIDNRRILTPTNSNGFSPGEAGSALLVTQSTSTDRGLYLLSYGFGTEDASIEKENPVKAIGLTQVIRNVLADASLNIEDIDYRITDLNGEHYKFKEAALAMLRFERKPRGKLFDMWHPTEFLGEIGAAIVQTVLANALHAGEKNYAPGSSVLCHFSNDGGERAAIVAKYVDS